MENIIKCPHCDDFIIIEQINCGIFRHLVKENFEQINPHASKEECEKTIGYGCKKPFQIKINQSEIIVDKCDYI